MIGLAFQAVDTFFFRDGTPFSPGIASQDDVGGLFPPHPSTLAGAVRACLAQCNGWSGEGRWPTQLNPVLGDGPDDLGMLSFEGPFVLQGDQPLFPVPRHLLGMVEKTQENKRAWVPRAHLHPGSPLQCDLGEAVRLPELSWPGDRPPHDLKPSETDWLTRSGMEAALRGEVPSRTEVVLSEELWNAERRVGLRRDPGTRTAEEGMLYRARHVRLGDHVWLGMRVSGLPGDWKLPAGKVVPVGGESRMAECRSWSGDVALEMPVEAIARSGRLAIIALTPLDLDGEACLGGRKLDFLGGTRVVSACMERPQRIGGWDSLAGRPLPLRSVLAPGSVLFCYVDDAESFRQAAAATFDGPLHLGRQTGWGFGVVALGTWTE